MQPSQPPTHQLRHSHAGMTTPGGSTQLNPSGTVKLRPRQLRQQIHDLLKSDPAKAWSTHQVSAALGRTSGAVPLALRRLVELGQATQTPEGRFQFAASSAVLTPPAAAPAPPAAPAAPTNAKPAPVRRPNGDLYYPRALAGGNDIDVLHRLRAAKLPVLLYGPPGTGKTSLLEAAFPDLVTLAGDEDTAVGDLVGDYVPDGAGGYRWVDGPLTVAMQTGAVLLVDDATLISPKVLASLYPAMDGRGQIILKANGGRIVHAAPGFYTVAGHNPGVHGAILTEALASRFTAHIKVSTDYDLALTLGVDRRVVAAARVLSAKTDTGEVGWAPQMRELLGCRRLAAEVGLDAAVANLIGIAPPEDRDAVATAFKDALRAPAPTPLALGNQI